MKSNAPDSSGELPVPKNCLLLVVRQVRLAEQERLALAPAEERPQVAQELVRVGQPGLLRVVVGLQQRGHRVHPEAVDAQLGPEAGDPGDLVAHLGVRHVEVRLEAVEAVQVVAAALLVVLPDARLLAGERDVARRDRRQLVDQTYQSWYGELRALPRGLEPRVLHRGVVGHQVGDHPHAAVVRGAQELDDVAEGAQPRVDGVEVADVVAVVLQRARVERHQPDAGHAEVGQVVDLAGQPGEVTPPVAVAVGVPLDVQAVDDGVLQPQVAGVGDAHVAVPTPRGGGAPVHSRPPCVRPVDNSAGGRCDLL